MTSTANEGLARFLFHVSAETSVPGGGSVSAIAAAFAAALGSMAGRFTVGREKYKEGEAEAAAAVNWLDGQQGAFLGLADEDAAAYSEVEKSLKLPKATPEEKAARAAALEIALVKAARPPLEVARRALDVAERLLRLRPIANPNLLSDLGVGLLLTSASARGALLNVFVNAKSVKTEATRSALDAEARALWRRLREVDDAARGIADSLASAPLE